MENKLTSSVIQDLSFLSLKELQMILQSFNDYYDDDYFSTLKYVIKRYTDKDIVPFLQPIKFVNKDNRSQEEKITELRSYYKKDDPVNTFIEKRGRKKKDKTLKDEIFELLDTKGAFLKHKECLNEGLSLSENTFKTLCCQWRQARGIILKRGRKNKGGV